MLCAPPRLATCSDRPIIRKLDWCAGAPFAPPRSGGTTTAHLRDGTPITRLRSASTTLRATRSPLTRKLSKEWVAPRARPFLRTDPRTGSERIAPRHLLARALSNGERAICGAGVPVVDAQPDERSACPRSRTAGSRIGRSCSAPRSRSTSCRWLGHRSRIPTCRACSATGSKGPSDRARSAIDARFEPPWLLSAATTGPGSPLGKRWEHR